MVKIQHFDSTMKNTMIRKNLKIITFIFCSIQKTAKNYQKRANPQNFDFIKAVFTKHTLLHPKEATLVMSIELPE